MHAPLFKAMRLVALATLTLVAPQLRAEDPRPTLGPVRTAPEGATLTVGHAKLAFSGRFAPLLKGGKQVGLFLEGKGTVDYASTFDPEWRIFTTNLKAWTSLKPVPSPSALTLTIPFTEARLYLGGTPLPAWTGAEAAPLETPYAAFDQRWSKVDGYDPAHLMALQALNAPASPASVLELDQDGDQWIHTYDGVDDMTETLECTRPFQNEGPDLKGWTYRIGLSKQYVGWDPRKGLAPARYLLSGLDVDLRTRDNRNAEMVVQETFTPLAEGLQAFEFNLWSILIDSKDTRHLRVARITDGEGHAVAFDHSHDHLLVTLPTPARRGIPFTLKVEYGGDFLVQPGRDSYWELGVREGWYPTPARYANEYYTFHGVVRTMGDWIAFLPGETVRRGKEGEWNLVETRTPRPINFTTILGGRYYLDEETHDGLTIRIATYAFKPGKANQVFKAQGFNVINYYQRFLGPFPFKEFQIVEKNAWGYGQAPPGMMYITRDAFEQVQEGNLLQAYASVAEQASRNGAVVPFQLPTRTMDVRHVFAHEIAHQYWGIVVKMPSAEEQWITESFADYCSALFERDYKGKNLFERDVARWEDGAESAALKAPIPLANEILERDGRDRFLTRTNLLYAKGPVLLHALHEELGDQAFMTWLKSIQTNFRWKFVTTWQMFDLLDFMTKKDYMPFYRSYYWGVAMPPAKH